MCLVELFGDGEVVDGGGRFFGKNLQVLGGGGGGKGGGGGGGGGEGGGRNSC